HENESNYSDIKDIIITSISKENVLPTSYTLYQNYPNPFNPSTNINFDIVENTNVSLIIFNVLGEEVKNVINQKLNAGAYSINVNFENIESGIYFYRISTNNFTETKKMIFIK
ncbi:MAG: T9SS type A sorting domain-containing protein, partial [Ignavibacteriae bacterium]|nr:T9SS type A sorting domain-containing protein [Ignavibacteriota bacterium]